MAVAPAGKKGPRLQAITIEAPNFGHAVLDLEALPDVPYVQHRFGQEAIRKMREAQELGGAPGKKRRAKTPRDFDRDYEGAFYRFPDGGYGMPASCFRNALISACRLVGFPMTMAKLSIFVEADGRDKFDSTPLVRLIGEPVRTELPVRNATGVADIRVRPFFFDWRCVLRVRWDLNQFTEADVAALVLRAGAQVGVGEGRPDSRDSRGMGWGLFALANGVKKKNGKKES